MKFSIKDFFRKVTKSYRNHSIDLRKSMDAFYMITASVIKGLNSVTWV